MRIDVTRFTISEIAVSFRNVTLSPVSEASREVANLTWRKNPHTPSYGVKEFVCLSVAILSFIPFEFKNWNYFKKACNCGCRRSFCKPVFASKTAIFGITFLAGNNYPDWHHLQGVWNLPHKFHLYLIICWGVQVCKGIQTEWNEFQFLLRKQLLW